MPLLLSVIMPMLQRLSWAELSSCDRDWLAKLNVLTICPSQKMSVAPALGDGVESLALLSPHPCHLVAWCLAHVVVSKGLRISSR